MIAKVHKESGNDRNNQKRRQDRPQATDDCAGKAHEPVSDIGAYIRGQNAGGTLADGQCVQKLFLAQPFVIVHHFFFYNGDHGHTAAESKSAD